MLDLAHNLLNNEKDNTNKYVEGLIDSEMGYIFTNDYSYYARKGRVIKVLKFDHVWICKRIEIAKHWIKNYQ